MGDDTDQAIRDIVRGAGIVYVGLVLQMGVAFLAQILAARYLSIGGFGYSCTTSPTMVGKHVHKESPEQKGLATLTIDDKNSEQTTAVGHH